MSGSTDVASPQQVLEFWFSESHRRLWFRSTADFDTRIRRLFEPTYLQALNGSLDHFRQSTDGVLALVIVLDQFPLNMYRGKPESFGGETLAREVASDALELGLDKTMSDTEKAFFYLPFMHSEDPADQDRSVALFEAAGLTENLRWARHHRDIVRRFGRFPHRNDALGRTSSAEELAWLASPEAFHG